MKKIFPLISVFLSLASYSQSTEIQNGTYFAKTVGQNIKLIISENKNFDLSFLSGKYEIRNDSIIFKNPLEKKSTFDVTYTIGEKSLFEKIKIKLTSNSYDFANIYIATYNEKGSPNYKRISDIIKSNGNDKEDGVALFEMERGSFLELAKENYLNETEISKFKLPNNISEITIADNYNQALNLVGIFDKNTKSVTISENSRNPLVFRLESDIKTPESEEIIQPIKSKRVSNWTYVGKDNYPLDTTQPGVVDATANTTPQAEKFQLKVEKKYLDALKATSKTPHKYLVIYYDPKNKEAKKQFDTYIESESTNIQYNMYSGYEAKYDLYNYYMASKEDEKWFKIHKIKNYPCVVVVNSDGEVLSQANKTFLDLQSQFYYYDDFNKKLNRTNALLNFKKALSKKQSDSKITKAFAAVSALEIPYGYIQDIPPPAPPATEPVIMEDVKFAPPAITPKIKGTENDIKTEEAIKENPNLEKENPENDIKTEEPKVIEAIYDEKPNFNTFTEVNFDKKQVQLIWNNLIQNHKNDVQPNIDLALVIIKELKNEGFTKQLFNEEKIIDATNFEALDYIFKHYDSIEQARLKSTYNVDAIHNLDIIESEISKILTVSIRLIKPETPIETQEKIIACYKKLLTKNKTNKVVSVDYFRLLKDIAISSNSETQYIQEYDAFFNETFDGKTNIFEKLDTLFHAQYKSGYEYWNEFKDSYSNLSNEAAWYVVEHSKNPETIKKAIKWSENSLIITKKNHYYLDTLAQLYYKNGEKQKAIETEQLAIDNNTVSPESVDSYKEVLEKMKNGTY